MKFEHTEHRQPACCFEPGPACCASLPEPRGIRSPLSRSILANPSLRERAGGPVSMFLPATRRQNRYTEYPGAVCPRGAPPCRWLRTRGSSRTFPQVSCRRLMRVTPHQPHRIHTLASTSSPLLWMWWQGSDHAHRRAPAAPPEMAPKSCRRSSRSYCTATLPSRTCAIIAQRETPASRAARANVNFPSPYCRA